MSDPKTTTPPLIGVQTRAYEADLDLLDRIAALAILEGWPGEWNTRPMALHSLLPYFVSKLAPEHQATIMKAT